MSRLKQLASLLVRRSCVEFLFTIPPFRDTNDDDERPFTVKNMHSLNTKNLGPANNLHPLLRADTVRNSRGVFVVVNQEQLEVGEVSDEEFLVAGREEVLGLGV